MARKRAARKAKTIGILGGMGPEATAHFFRLVIENTAAGRDQDHASVLIWNDPSVPARTDAILGKGLSPLPSLLRGARLLQAAGSGLIVMPCVTAHHWAAEIAAECRVPFVHLLGEAVRAALKEMPGLKRAGLIASSGTVASKLWPRAFGKRGVEILTPGPREQEDVMEAIFGPEGIKAGFTSGRPRTAILRIARRLVRQGAEAVIAGCTEIPLVLREGDLTVPLIEPLAIAARACLLRAGYSLR
jgi:aspartate racemase